MGQLTCVLYQKCVKALLNDMLGTPAACLGRFTLIIIRTFNCSGYDLVTLRVTNACSMFLNRQYQLVPCFRLT